MNIHRRPEWSRLIGRGPLPVSVVASRLADVPRLQNRPRSRLRADEESAGPSKKNYDKTLKIKIL
jgi:hypothetical protein